MMLKNGKNRDDSLSFDDQNAIKKLQSDWQAANAKGDTLGMQAAHSGAEGIRQKSGYSGGADGSEDIPKYNNLYKEQMDDKANDILGREDFSYNYETDPMYAHYANAYRREGDRARENTLADVATMTGGVPSSYAVTASQQAQGYYNQQLADKIPQLQQIAYQMYQDGINNDRNDLQMLNGMDSKAFGQFESNRNYDYTAGRAAAADANYANELTLSEQKYAADVKYRDETDEYNKEQNALNQKAQTASVDFSEAMQIWAATGVLDAQSAQILGLPVGTKSSSYQFALAEQAFRESQGAASQQPKNAGYSGGGAAGGSNMASANKQKSNTKGGFLASSEHSLGNAETLGGGDLGDRLSEIDYMVNSGRPKDAIETLNKWVEVHLISETDAENIISQYGFGSKENQMNMSDYTVTNKSGVNRDWVYVPGYGRLSGEDLENALQEGTIVEKIDYNTGKVSYSKAK